MALLELAPLSPDRMSLPASPPSAASASETRVAVADPRGGLPGTDVGAASRTHAVVSGLTNAAGTLLIIGALLAFLFLAIGPRFLGYQTATMLTGSMTPSIVPGDVVVTTEQPVTEVQVGDVISYHIPVEDHRVETHRVVEVIANPDGTTAVRTKGDANETVDPWIATLDGDHVLEQAFVIPVVGDVIRALRTPVVSTSLVYGAPAVLVVGLLTMIWSRPTSDTTGTADMTAPADPSATAGATRR